jgi:hypothetical protein
MTDIYLDLPDARTAPNAAPPSMPAERTGDVGRRTREEAEKEGQLLALLAEQEKRLREQAERDNRIVGLLAPTEEQQRARYERLNEFLRQVMERVEQAAIATLTSAQTAAGKQREQALRQSEAWRGAASRRSTILTWTIAFLLMLQTAAIGCALWRSARGSTSQPSVQAPLRTSPATGLSSKKSPSPP